MSIFATLIVNVKNENFMKLVFLVGNVNKKAKKKVGCVLNTDYC